MARPTFPRVFWDEESGMYCAQMIDKKTGKVWGCGYGETRQDAIRSAAIDQPPAKSIKRAIGWVDRHPFIAGAAVGTYLTYRYAKNHHYQMKASDYLSVGAIAGTIAWALSKIFSFWI